MPTPMTSRYCADTAALDAMKRDGLGWGHDLACGTYYDHAATAHAPVLRRFATLWKRGV